MASSGYTRSFIVLAVALLAMAEGRTLLRRHGSHHRHHHRSEPSDLENYLPRHLPLDYLDKRFQEPSAELQQRDLEPLRFPVDEFSEGRRKRHNLRHGNVHYRKMTDEDKRELKSSMQQELARTRSFGSSRNKRYDEDFELEVREAQNSSICNYTVVSIPDTRGNRIPKDLEHVMCNHAGSRCQAVGTYCCIQTYRKIEVAYTDSSSEMMKIYAGCVCSLQLYDELESPKLRLDD